MSAKGWIKRAQSLKKKTLERKTLEWFEKNEKGKIVWKVTSEEEYVLKKVKYITVKQGERAALFNSGIFTRLLSPGKSIISGSFDTAYFLDITPQTNKVGIRAPDYPITSDEKSFGFSGNIILKIMDDRASIGNFITKIVEKYSILETKEIVRWLRDGLLFQVFKEIIREFSYTAFINVERLSLLIELESRLGAELRDYGLEVVSLELMHFTPARVF
jgi:regulator of protease activity HflC (stomatin/prohibitin superfamily)